MRTEFLPFHLPSIADEEIRAVVDTMRSGWLTTGCRVKHFEQEFAKLVGAQHAVAVNSGTAALHLALEALGIGEGDEVIVPTMTFAATAEVVAYLRATPVLVDCEPTTLNISCEAVRRAVTSRTRAIVPVHFGGLPCQMDQLMGVACEHGLDIVEDAAHALPASFGGEMIGSMSYATCFSFYATKTITTGEGGMVTTNDAERARRMRMMALHGLSRDAWKRYSREGAWQYEILAPGFKYNLTDIAAAIGVEQLRKCCQFWERRRDIARMYSEAFAESGAIRTPVTTLNTQHAWHLYIVQLELDQLRIDRDTFIEELRRQNIGTSVHFMPLHLHPYYRQAFGHAAHEFPNASAAFSRILSLPIFPSMSENDVQDVIEAVTATIERHAR